MSRLDERDPQWQAHVRNIVAAAPPMTAAQIAKLSALFAYTEPRKT